MRVRVCMSVYSLVVPRRDMQGRPARHDRARTETGTLLKHARIESFGMCLRASSQTALRAAVKPASAGIVDAAKSVYDRAFGNAMQSAAIGRSVFGFQRRDPKAAARTDASCLRDPRKVCKRGPLRSPTDAAQAPAPTDPNGCIWHVAQKIH